jgi:hypothetical protein
MRVCLDTKIKYPIFLVVQLWADCLTYVSIPYLKIGPTNLLICKNRTGKKFTKMLRSVPAQDTQIANDISYYYSRIYQNVFHRILIL